MKDPIKSRITPSKYEMDLKMAQKGCDRDRSRDKICIQISKWPNYIFPFELGHFEVCESYYITWSMIYSEISNGPKQKGKRIGPFSNLYAYIVTWPISVTAVLSHSEVYLGYFFEMKKS